MLEDLGAAEGLEGCALAVVNFHLREAVGQVEQAAALLPAPVRPSVPGPARGWDDRAGQSAAPGR